MACIALILHFDFSTFSFIGNRVQGSPTSDLKIVAGSGKSVILAGNDQTKNYVEILEEKPGKSALLRVHSLGEDGAVGGFGLRRNEKGNSTIGIGWESGREARWDLDLMAGTNDLNLNNKNLAGNLLLNFGTTLRFGVGTSERPEVPDIAMIDLDGLAVGTTVRKGISNRSIGLPNGGALSFANRGGDWQGTMFTGLDLGTLTNGDVVSLEAFGVKIMYALILVLDDSGERVGMYILQGAAQSTIEFLDPKAKYSANAGTENSVNIYFNNLKKRYELENRTGSPSAFRVFYFRRT